MCDICMKKELGICMKNGLKKYDGEVDGLLLVWLEQFDYEANDLMVDSEGTLFVKYEEDENRYHPDEPGTPSSYYLIVDLREVKK